jgi:hypothetical protein
VLELLAAHFGDVKGGIVTVSEQIQEAVSRRPSSR